MAIFCRFRWQFFRVHASLCLLPFPHLSAHCVSVLYAQLTTKRYYRCHLFVFFFCRRYFVPFHRVFFFLYSCAISLHLNGARKCCRHFLLSVVLFLTFAFLPPYVLCIIILRCKNLSAQAVGIRNSHHLCRAI